MIHSKVGSSDTGLAAIDSAGTSTTVKGNVRWNHLKTLALVTAVLGLYFCELLIIVGGGFLAPSIAAIIGGADKAAWPSMAVILFTVALGAPICQASDYWGRKWFLVIPNIGGIIGAIVSARATSMGMYISGFCIGGIGFGSQGLFLAVISEVLPREYRSWSQAAANGVNALGSIFALSIGGYLIKSSREGFRTYFYICAGIYAIATLMLALLYNPIPRELQATLTMKQKITSLDWIGYIFLATGTVLFCLGLTWAQNPYRWTNPHVLVPLLVGVMLLCILAVYAWRFRKDGLFHHSLFCDRNYVISLIAIFIEGMSYMAAGIYFPASLSVVQAGKMSAYRQALCYMVGFCAFGVCSFATGLYIYKRKTVRITGMLTFVMMLVFFIVMSTVTVKTSEANFWGYILFYGMGIGLAFVTFVTSAQFATKPELIAVTTGLLISVRSLGGSIGVAIFNAISASGYGANVLPKVTKAVLPLGLPDQNITPLIDALGTANMTLINSVPGVTPQIVSAAGLGIRQAHVLGYRNVFICGGAFSVVGIITAAFLHNPTAEFNAKIDAPIEIPTSKDVETKQATEQHIEDEKTGTVFGSTFM